MLGQGHVGNGNALEQAVVDHSLRPVAGFLGRLEGRQQGPAPLVTVIGHELDHAEQAGHVHVMAAGVGYRDLMTLGVLRGGGAGVVRAGVLLDRQRVQFGRKQHRGPGATGKDAHDSRPADARSDRAAILVQLPGDALGRAVLLVRQLGMLMQILVERFLAGLEAVVTGQDLLETAHNRRPPYSMSSSRRLVLASSTSSLPSPDRTVRVANSVKPLTSP